MDTTAYELADPGEPDLPRWIGFGPSPSPWVALWGRECGIEPQLAEWFNSLRLRGCTPLVRRSVTFSTLGGASGFVRWRLDQIADWCNGWPGWLLNEPQARVAKPVIQERPDGSRERYRSIRQASQRTRFTRESISAWARSGCAGSDGSRWWFDFAG